GEEAGAEVAVGVHQAGEGRVGHGQGRAGEEEGGEEPHRGAERRRAAREARARRARLSRGPTRNLARWSSRPRSVSANTNSHACLSTSRVQSSFQASRSPRKSKASSPSAKAPCSIIRTSRLEGE